jgi:hypothetical protein
MRKPSPATVIASVALFIVLGGVGFAATGGNFRLGRMNTTDDQTSLTGAAPNPQLRVENTSMDGNARGVVGLISSASATAGSAGLLGATAATDPGSAGVVAQNTGGGPALKAVVNQGAAPLTVNSSTKVTNLNADKLDGLNSTQFVQGGGSVDVIHAGETTLPGDTHVTRIGTLGGIALVLLGYCSSDDNGVSGAQIQLANITGSAVTLLREGSQGPTTARVLENDEIDADMPVLPANHFKWHGRAGNQVFTIDTWSYFNADNITCTWDVRMTIDP